MNRLSLIVLFSIVVAIYAQSITINPTVSYSGYFPSAPSWNIPDIDSDLTCTTASTYDYPYAFFNYTFSTGGVRRLVFFGSLSDVFVYQNDFDPTHPCNNNPTEFSYNSADSVYDFEVNYWFEAGIKYVFVITGDYYNFQVALYDSDIQGSSLSTENTWYPVYFDSGDCYVADSYNESYSKWTFNAAQTGYFDISVVYYANLSSSYSDYTWIALFSGLNPVLSQDACTDNPTSIIDADEEDGSVVTLEYIHLTQGQDYSVVVSSEFAHNGGKYALFFEPTHRVFFTTTPTWDQPERDLTDACATNDDLTDQPWASYALGNVTEYTNFTVVASQDGGDYEFFVYSGSNLGVLGASPFTCPVLVASLFDYQDDLDEVYFSGDNDFFSIVVSWYYDTSSIDGDEYSDIYYISGPSLTGGYVPPANTATTATVAGPVAGPVSGNPSSVTTGTRVSTAGSVTTGGAAVVTSGSATATTVRATTATTGTAKVSTTTNSGSFLTASFALIVFAAFALFF